MQRAAPAASMPCVTFGAALNKEILVNIVKKLGNSVLGLFLSNVKAGACVPIHTHCCGTRGHAYNCWGACAKGNCAG